MQDPINPPILANRGSVISGKIGTRKYYKARPFVFISLVYFKLDKTNPTARMAYELSMQDDVPFIRIVTDRMHSSSTVNAIGYDVFLLCPPDRDCLTQSDDKIIVGEAKGYFTTLFDYNGTARSETIETALSVFRTSPPKYFAFGVHEIMFNKGFSITLQELTNNKLVLKYNQVNSGTLSRIKVSYILSDWGKN